MAIKRYQIRFENFTTVLLLLLITTIIDYKDLIAQRPIQKALMIFKALNNLVPILSSVFTERIESCYAIRDSAKN